MKRFVVIGLLISVFCIQSDDEQRCPVDVEGLRDDIQELQKDIKDLHIDAQDIQRKFEQFEEDIAPFKKALDIQFFVEPDIQPELENDEDEEAS